MNSDSEQSSSALDKACQKVGRFMHDFAHVEAEINAAIAGILSLKGNAAELLHSIDFAKKLNMLRTILLDLAPEAEHRELEKLVSSIFKENEYRTIMAHASFQPAAAEVVEFSRTVAKDGKVKPQKIAWTPQMFAESSDRLRNIRIKLAHFRPSLDIGLGEKGLTTTRRGPYVYHAQELIPWSQMASDAERQKQRS